MQEVFNFLIQNWRLVLEVILLIFSVVILIIKKKPVKVVDTIKEFIVEYLPAAIVAAESVVFTGKGSDKKDMVIDSCLNEIKKAFGFTYEQSLYYLKFISQMIEVILSTPQKKGE